MIQLLKNKKAVLVILTLMLMIFGFRLFTTNYTPLKCTLAEYEKMNNPDAHDFYILSGAYTTGDAYYVRNSVSHIVKQFVYPIVSKEMMDEAKAKYAATHNDSSTESAEEWIAKNVRPKVFMLSKHDRMSSAEMTRHINEIDSAEILGERLRQLDNINTKIKDAMTKDGYAEGSYLLLKEDFKRDENPQGSKSAGMIMMALGIFLLWRIFKKKDPSKTK